MLHSLPRVVARLADAYFAARGASPPAAPAALDAVEKTLADLWIRGRAGHPEFGVDGASFAAHLGHCGAAVEGLGSREIHAEDLYLCCAALIGDEVAVRALRDRHQAVLPAYVGPIDRARPFLDEVEQRLWDSALIRAADRPPKLASYSGKGPLVAWIGVAAQRIALMMRRSEAAEKRALGNVAAETRSALADPELAFIKENLREPFESALKQAIASLDDRQRMIYSLHIVDGLTVERIGTMYGVSHTTISRWLASARADIVAEARRLLERDAHIAADEFDSLARLLASQLDLSSSLVLAKPV